MDFSNFVRSLLDETEPDRFQSRFPQQQSRQGGVRFAQDDADYASYLSRNRGYGGQSKDRGSSDARSKMQDKMEKADIVRDLVADRERDQIKIKKLTELTSHLMANNSLLQLCQSLNEGQSIPTSAITQVVHENIAIQLAIYDVISVMFNNVDSCRRVDKVIKSLSLNRLHTPATADEERAEKDFDDRFEALIDSLKKEGAGDRLLKAGALDSFHKHGGQSSAASSNDKK